MCAPLSAQIPAGLVILYAGLDRLIAEISGAKSDRERQ
jgi:hypothetical protein